MIKKILHRNLSDFSALRNKFNSLEHSKNLIPGLLFGIEGLNSHNGGFVPLVEKLTKQVDLLKMEVHSHKNKKIIEIIDEISNEICKLADLAEFVRGSHPSELVRKEAEYATLGLSEVIESFNTNKKIYSALTTEMDEKIYLNDEDNYVAQLLCDEFESSAIHLDDVKRLEFVNLSKLCLQHSFDFLELSTQPSYAPILGNKKYFEKIYLKSGIYYVIDTGNLSPNENIRRMAYKMYFSDCSKKQESLNKLLQTRQNLAELCGFENYFERTIQSMLCPGSESLQNFLYHISERLPSLIDSEVENTEKLLKMNNVDIHDKYAPWNINYYNHYFYANIYKSKLESILEYFSLGSCIEGIAMLMEKLFGVTIEESSTEKSEETLWNSDIVKLCVKRSNNMMGYIYCDLYGRKGKISQNCHHTIRCAKKFKNGSCQIPIAVILLNLEPNDSKPTFLDPSMVRTLFHEFGHAMHTLFGQTTYQHVSGTRCPTDFAEVPSILMEYFAFNFYLLKQYARHYDSGLPISDKDATLIADVVRVDSPIKIREMILYSLLDFQLSSSKLHSPDRTRTLFRNIVKDVSYKFYDPALAPYLCFSHLANYGGKYYSYLLSGAIASRIYYENFYDVHFDRFDGKMLYDVILRHGGSRPPVVMLNEFFKDDVFDMTKYSHYLVESLSIH